MEENIKVDDNNNNVKEESNTGALVLGILSIVLAFSFIFSWVGIILGILALVFSIKSKYTPGKVLGGIGILLGVLIGIIGISSAIIICSNPKAELSYYVSDGYTPRTNEGIIQVGEEYSSQDVSSKNSGNEGTLTVSEIEDFTSNDKFNSPKTGNKFVVVTFEIKNESVSEGLNVDSYAFTLESEDSSYKAAYVSNNDSDGQFLENYYTLKKGGVKTHKLIFEVPVDETLTEFNFNDFNVTLGTNLE